MKNFIAAWGKRHFEKHLTDMARHEYQMITDPLNNPDNKHRTQVSVIAKVEKGVRVCIYGNIF